MRSMRCPLFLLLTIYWAGLTGFSQTALDSRKIAQDVLPAVLQITGSSRNGEVAGTGFIISSDGKAVTSLHVIEQLETGKVRLPSGEIFDTFSVLAFDARRDLAIVSFPGFDLPTVELGNSNHVQPGEPVLLVGSPLGLGGTMTTGIVSAVRVWNGVKLIQTDAAANPGNSGGPLVNSRGQVVGVLGFKLRDAENLSFAMPINHVQGMMSHPSPLSLTELRGRLEVRSGVNSAAERAGGLRSSEEPGVLFSAFRAKSHRSRSSEEVFTGIVNA